MKKLKGIPVLLPVKEVREGMSVVYENMVWVVGKNADHFTVRNNIGRYRELVIEYREASETRCTDTPFGQIPEIETKHLPLSSSDQEYILKNNLVGKKIDFEIKKESSVFMEHPTEGTIYDWDEFDVAKLIIQEPEEESWDDIYRKWMSEHQSITDFTDYMRKYYHVPKRRQS